MHMAAVGGGKFGGFGAVRGPLAYLPTYDLQKPVGGKNNKGYAIDLASEIARWEAGGRKAVLGSWRPWGWGFSYIDPPIVRPYS